MAEEQRFNMPLHSELATSPRKPTARIKTDNQQTSFEEARQFKYFDRIVDVPTTSQIVYRLVISSPINLTHRKLTLSQGGREYLVYRADQVDVSGATFVDSGLITAMNQNPDASVSVVPSPYITFSRAIGSGILTVNANELPSDGLIVLTDGNANRASNELDDDSDKLGYAAQTLYVLLDNLAQSTASTGQLRLKWEAI